MRRSLSSTCYRFSLWLWILLIILVLLAALYDIGQQLIVGNDSDTRAGDIIIAASTYVAIGLLALIITLSRLITVKRTLTTVPKAYMPVKREDVPKAVHALIATEYARCALISHISQPSDRQLPGWGAPGTKMAGLRFRTAILDTVKVIDQLYAEDLAPADLIPYPTAQSPYHSPIRPLYPICFESRDALLPHAFLPVFKEYEAQVARAKFGVDEPDEDDFRMCYSAMLVIVSEVKKALLKRANEDAVSLSSESVEL